MSKIKQVDYSYMNWGPFVMKTTMPNYIIKKLLTEGKKLKQSYNRSLAGHLDHQYLYTLEIQRWFYDEINPIEEKTLNSKLEVLNKVNDYLRKKDSNVKQVTASFSGEQKSIEIVRSGGETLTDVRPLIRFNVSVML